MICLWGFALFNFSNFVQTINNNNVWTEHLLPWGHVTRTNASEMVGVPEAMLTFWSAWPNQKIEIIAAVCLEVWYTV